MSPAIVGLGLRCLDIVLTVAEMPNWESGSEVGAFLVQGGGPAGTACAAAARLGVKAGYVGTYGSDLFGNLKLRTLSEHGVDVSRARRRPGPEQQVAFVFVDEATGERAFAPARGLTDNPLEAHELDRAYIAAAEFLILDGFHPAAAGIAARWARAAGRRVLLDLPKPTAAGAPVPDYLRRLVESADIVIGGEGCLAWLAGAGEPLAAAKRLLGIGPRVIVETWGERGSLTVTADRDFFTPAFAVRAVNTTGAGDVFNSAFACALLWGAELEQAARFASAAAAITCTRLGGPERLPSRGAVEKLLGAAPDAPGSS